MKPSGFLVLKKRREFLAVAESKLRVYGEYFLLQALRNNELSGIFRVGYVVTRKTGNAVKRNKAKRRLKALVYQLKEDFKPNYDYVLVARASLWSSSFKLLQHDFCNVIKKIEKFND